MRGSVKHAGGEGKSVEGRQAAGSQKAWVVRGNDAEPQLADNPPAVAAAKALWRAGGCNRMLVKFPSCCL